MRLYVLTQVSPAETGGARLSGGTAALPGREEPGAAGQGRVGRTGDPVCQRPADRSLQGPQPKAEARRGCLGPNRCQQSQFQGKCLSHGRSKCMLYSCDFFFFPPLNRPVCFRCCYALITCTVSLQRLKGQSAQSTTLSGRSGVNKYAV